MFNYWTCEEFGTDRIMISYLSDRNTFRDWKYEGEFTVEQLPEKAFPFAVGDSATHFDILGVNGKKVLIQHQAGLKFSMPVKHLFKNKKINIYPYYLRAKNKQDRFVKAVLEFLTEKLTK